MGPVRRARRDRWPGRESQRRLGRRALDFAVRLDGMGDVLMTTPALRALKEGRPPVR